jgi:hypothetical protein
MTGRVAQPTIVRVPHPKPALSEVEGPGSLGWGFRAERLVIFMFVKIELKLVEGRVRLGANELTL